MESKVRGQDESEEMTRSSSCKHEFRYRLLDEKGNKVKHTPQESKIVVTCSKCGFTHTYQHEQKRK